MTTLTDNVFGFIENRVTPVAGKAASQRHIMAMRDGFISAMPFMIVGSFLLIFAFPPFAADSNWAIAQVWLQLAERYQGQLLTPFNMTMGIMSVYITAAISYNLAQSYSMEPFMPAMLSLMSFLLVAAPLTEGGLPAGYLGGTGIFTAILVSLYSTELMYFLQRKNIGIKMPE